MKTKLNHTPWLVLAAFLLTGLHEANAWYSPSQQRWINRDPEGEYGGYNLYGFVSQNPVSFFDPFGLQRGIPVPREPAPDTCDPDRRKHIEDAMQKACDRINKGCNDPECQEAIAKAKKGCENKRKAKVRCAKAGDKDCGPNDCAYEDGTGITLCPKAWPPDGSNCNGDTGPMTLECILVHELVHVGAGYREKNKDDANKAQKCLGCPSGAPHKK